MHSIYVRTKNDFGIWSLPSEGNFYITKIDTAKIQSIHYRIFQNNDEGEWLSNPVEPERKVVDSIIGFSLEGLIVNEEYSVEIFAENNLGVRSYSVFTNPFTLRENHEPIANTYSLDFKVYTKETASIDFDTLFTDEDLIYGDSLTFTYVDLSDGELYTFSDSTSTVISVAVVKINHTPVAVKDEIILTSVETGQLQIDMDTLFDDEDIPDGDILSFSILDTSSTSVSGFSNWTTSSILYITPQEGNDGIYTFWLIASDTEEAQDSISVSLTVENINHAPVTLKESISSTITENESWQLSMDTLFNDEDIANGDVLTYLLINTSSTGGEFSSWVSDDVLQFYPQSGNNGSYSYWLKATDMENEADSIEISITVTETVGISNIYKEEYLVSPNPNNGIFNIELETSGVEKSQIYIYSIEGKLHKSFKYKQQEINISDLPKGIYILRIITPNNSFEERIIIDK